MNKLSTCIELPNGYRISIQHSSKHYCGPDTAEVAVIYKSQFMGNFPFCTEGDSVAPYVSSPQLIEIINWAASQ